MKPKKTYTINGTRFFTLEEFYQEINDILVLDVYWGHNLDAFHDILGGGFGTPEEGFILIWHHTTLSKERLGYPETVRQLQKRLKKCHPASREHISALMEQAKREEGPTVFDWLVEIINGHTPDGDYAVSGVELILA